MTPAAWLAREARAVSRESRLAAVYGVTEGLLIILQAGLIAWIVQRVVMDGLGVQAMLVPGALLIGVVVLRPGAQILRARMAIRASSRVRERVRGRLIDHAEMLGPTGLAGRNTGETASHLTEQISALDGYYARYRPQLAVAVAVPLAIAITALTQDWIAGLFFVVSAPLIPLFMALVGMGAERLNRDQFEAVARLSGQFLDRVRGLTTLRLFGRVQDAAEGILAGSDEYRRRSMRVLRVAFLSSAVLEFFASVAIAVIAIYIGFGLLGYIEFGPAPALTLFSGLFVLLLAPEFFQPLRTLAQHYHDRATALGAAELLMEFEAVGGAETASARGTGTGTENSGTENSGTGTITGENSGENSGTGTITSGMGGTGTVTQTPSAPRVPGMQRGHNGLHAQQLVLERPGRGVVLQARHLEAAPGERVLVEGPSGSGKTTLLLALAGLLEPTAGTIERPVNDARVGWLGAPPFIANASLRDNIRLGYPQADEAALAAAAERAGVTEFSTRLPRGLDTAIGERGVGLSGGQAQRVALARAFVSPACLILLDEPTAALDAETERYVTDALEALAAEGRIVVIASHDQALRDSAERRYEIKNAHLEPVSDA